METTANHEKHGNRVKIFDTTLRDGEQSPGATMTPEDKLRIAILLSEMGVDIIEAGFPISSHGDFESVQAIAEHMGENTTVCALSRARLKDIDRAWEAVKHAKSPRIHTFISTSALHMQYKLEMKPKEVLQAIESSVSYAANLCRDVQWSPEDATRSDVAFLCEAIKTALACGATTINIPDTVGYSIPDEFSNLISMLQREIPELQQATIAVHCHDDLGFAVANSIAALNAGARQIECTINGLGERAGNAALEEIVMAIKVRNAVLPFVTKIDCTHLTRASRLVSLVTGLSVQHNKAIVGRNAFAHESGIHQDGMLKHTSTYEIMKPSDVGLTQSDLVIGKHSGRHAFHEKVAALGFRAASEELEEAFCKMKLLADRKRTIYDEDIVAIIFSLQSEESDSATIELKTLNVVCGTEGPQTAEISLSVNGRIQHASTEGTGPIDSTFNAIREITQHKCKLLLYQVHAVTQETDAQAEVSVRLEEDSKIVTGYATDTNTIVASARAYINALNTMQRREVKI